MEPSKASSTASFTDQVDHGAGSRLAFPGPDVPAREPNNDVRNNEANDLRHHSRQIAALCHTTLNDL